VLVRWGCSAWPPRRSSDLSDAEELGLLGAQLFVNKHPWAKDVGLVLNFEARGSGGPSYMLLETNNGNKKLVETFEKSGVEFPVRSEEHTSELQSREKLVCR